MRRLLLAIALLAACGGSGGDDDDDAPGGVTVSDGLDWSLPDGTTPAADSGFYSEEADPAYHVDTRVVDLSWRQLKPTPTSFDTTATDTAQGFELASFDDQLAIPGPFWLRVWASAVDWAPAWVATDCGVDPVTGTDEFGQQHLPIWNACVWGHLRDLWEELLVDRGLLADPDLQLVYVPGGFSYAEFDFEVISNAAVSDGLTFATFDAWFQQAIADLVAIAGSGAGKLVYTGEDYPFGPFDTDDDLLARDAVAAGLGIRNGITELSNFHLSQAPAYGSTIADDGHLITDDAWVTGHVSATENECYNACGFETADVDYAITMSNYKALQLRVNWLYVVPEDSYLDALADHWEWVRLELGRTAADAPDAWVVLREAEDTYWNDDDSLSWSIRPRIRNLERWLVQRDQGPDGVTVAGTEVHEGELAPENGVATEGRRTDRANGQDRIYFELDPAFTGPVDVKVTFLDDAVGEFWLETASVESGHVSRRGDGLLRTATIPVAEAGDFRLVVDQADLEVRFVRAVRQPS